MDNPEGAAFDKSGKIYVANGGTGDRGIDSLTVYRAESNTNAEPIATIGGTGGSDKAKLYDPVAVAVDIKGEIYVANVQGDSVTVYAPGSNGDIAPLREISGARTGINSPVGLAIDSASYLYLLNSSGGPHED